MNSALISTRNALRLAGFAVIVGTFLTLANHVTRQTIAHNKQQHLKATLKEVLPARYFDNNLPDTKINLFDQELQLNRSVYRGLLNNNPSAAILTTTTADGYAGPIKLLIGVRYDGTITGVRTLAHTETPGLGDDIEISKSSWILSFNDKSLESNLTWAVKRDGGDYDQFTGATITPRAVVRAVEQTLNWYLKNRNLIFKNL